MASLFLTLADLSHVRFLDTLGMDFETRLAELRLMEPRLDDLSEWRRKVRRKLRRVLPQASEPPDRSIFRKLAVEPFWYRIRSHLEQERAALARKVLTGGVEEAFNHLHPAITWKAPFLEIGDGNGPDKLCLKGEGMVLAPSLFARGPLFLPAKPDRPGLPAIVYNVELDIDTAATLWQTDEEDTAAALRDLLGHTRAGVLECLRVPGSTGDISRRLHISSPSASKHVSVLRRSGLVRTERKSNLAVHRLTDLGEAVLRS